VPRSDPAEFRALPLRAFDAVGDFPLHDVWTVDFPGARGLTIPALRSCLSSERVPALPLPVRALFAIRRAAGRALRLDEGAARDAATDRAPAEARALTPDVVAASRVRPGTREGLFRTVFVLDDEAAYVVRNATVHALLVVALTPNENGQRFYWGTYVAPVGPITRLYMALIDPFRRFVVYPGLERWLRRTVRESGIGRAT